MIKKVSLANGSSKLKQLAELAKTIAGSGTKRIVKPLTHFTLPLVTRYPRLEPAISAVEKLQQRAESNKILRERDSVELNKLKQNCSIVAKGTYQEMRHLAYELNRKRYKADKKGNVYFVFSFLSSSDSMVFERNKPDTDGIVPLDVDARVKKQRMYPKLYKGTATYVWDEDLQRYVSEAYHDRGE